MDELKALLFAAEAHRMQTRKLCELHRGVSYEKLVEMCEPEGSAEQSLPIKPHGGAYINHPLRMYAYLVEVDAPVVCRMAALLHDTIEDTETTEEDLYSKFPQEVVDVVLELTDDKSKAKATRKELQVQKAPGLSPDAKLVKLCDLYDNCYGLIKKQQTWPWDKQRVANYVAWAYQIHDGIIAGEPGEELELNYANWISAAGYRLVRVLGQFWNSDA